MNNIRKLPNICKDDLQKELADLLGQVTNENCILFCKNGNGWEKELSTGSRHDSFLLINTLRRRNDQRLGVCVTKTSRGFSFMPYNFILLKEGK